MGNQERWGIKGEKGIIAFESGNAGSGDAESGKTVSGKTSRRLLVLGLVAFTLLADQLTKAAIVKVLPPYSSRPLLPPLLSLTLVYNRGAAFSLFAGSQIVFVAISIVLLAGVILFRKQLTSAAARPADLGAALMAGGTIGNLIDRLRLGYVVDFLELPHWPVFNLADTALVLGTALVVLGIWRWESLSHDERSVRR